MATRVRGGRASFRRSFAGEAANQLSSEMFAARAVDLRNRRFEKGAQQAADRVERLSDRAKAFESSLKPITERLETMEPEVQQRAERATKSSGLYTAAVKAYREEYKRWEAGKPTTTYEQLVAMYRRQKEGGALHANATNRYHQYQNIRRAYDGLRNTMKAAYARQNAAAEKAKQAYKAYQKMYGGKDAGPVDVW